MNDDRVSGLHGRRRAMAFGAGGALWSAAAGRADAAAALPSTIRLIQGYQLGTLQDRYGRVFAQAVSMLHPSMRIIIESMPRANGRLAARQLMEAAPDGATIGTFQTALVYAELLGDEGVAFETARFGWIGSFTVEPRVLVVSSQLGVTTLDELRSSARPVPVGAETTSSVSAREPLLLNTLLGTRLRPVPGYSTAARNLALASGEIAAATASLDAVYPLITSGAVRVVLRLDRHAVPPPLDTLPTLHEVVGIGRASALFAFLDAQSRLGRWLCLPPGASRERLAAWRALFSQTIASDAFQRLVSEAGLAPDGSIVVRGDAIEAALAEIFRFRATSASALRAALACGNQLAETGSGTCE